MQQPPPPVVAPDPTVHRHDGFYLRAGLGPSVFWGQATPAFGDVSARGLGLAFDIAIGGTPAAGVVIGGTITTSFSGTVHWSGDGVRQTTERSSVNGAEGQISLIGVFVDYYPDPAGGFHVMGALGIGAMNFESDTGRQFPPEKWASAGAGGGVLGAGYEFWIGKQWSLGGVARVLYVRGDLEGARNTSADGTFSAQAIAPGILFSATLH